MTDASPLPDSKSDDAQIPDPSATEPTAVTGESTDNATREKRARPRRPLSQALKSTFRFFTRTDRETHGYVPFLLWITLLFGGFWFPATPFLNHVFNDEPAPINGMFGTTSQRNTLEIDRAEYVKANPQAATADDKKGEPVQLPGRHVTIGPLTTALFLPVSLVFWSWTNLALLCVMASAMGEVNRTAETIRGDRTKAATGTGGKLDPDYRTACTRAFFVYLFVLMNEIAIAGTLSSSGAGDSYKRVAILASATCFLASYRPDFFRGLIGKFAAKQEGDGDDDDNAGSESTDRDEAKPAQTARSGNPADEQPDYDREEEFAASGPAGE